MVNEKKSSLYPVQHLEHLGLLVDTEAFRISLSPSRQQTLQDLLFLVARLDSLDLKTLASLQGLMVS